MVVGGGFQRARRILPLHPVQRAAVEQIAPAGLRVVDDAVHSEEGAVDRDRGADLAVERAGREQQRSDTESEPQRAAREREHHDRGYAEHQRDRDLAGDETFARGDGEGRNRDADGQRQHHIQQACARRLDASEELWREEAGRDQSDRVLEDRLEHRRRHEGVEAAAQRAAQGDPQIEGREVAGRWTVLG